MATEPILKLSKVKKTFPKAERQDILVLDDVNFSLHEGEIVAILGQSGSGKSTLLRIIAGLIKASAGKVLYRNRDITGPMPGISMIFQHFALMPWLTVQQNVELGLEAQGMPPEERKVKALKAIDKIGLDGFESAYPKELSGGMRQRVGFARALVVNPDILLMDEPFSALDVLTAENLKTDLMDLWIEKQIDTKGIVFVTHNIEEAVIMAHRVIIFENDPGSIRAELRIDVPHPRNPQDQRMRHFVDEIYMLMSTRKEELGAQGLPFAPAPKVVSIDYRLPDVEVSELTGLLETIAGSDEPPSLPELADSLHLDVDNLFPLTELLDILRFAHVDGGNIRLTNQGLAVAEADIQEKKEIFCQHLMRHVPLARHVRRVLDERPGHKASKERFLTELEDFFSLDEAERVLKNVIEWGRYAEVFAYDDNSQVLSLENPT